MPDHATPLSPRPNGPHWALVALGSNLGDRDATLRAAVVSLRGLPGVVVVRTSAWHETEAVGPGVQGRYLNAAALLEIAHSSPVASPRGLLAALLSIEAALGRDRTAGERWGPRTIDLDLLLFDEAVVDEPGLCVPHPRLAERAFVLVPAAEIAPAMPVPAHGGTAAGTVEQLRHRLLGTPGLLGTPAGGA